MITRGRIQTLVGVLLTLAIVGPLAWMWWHSRLPSSYSVMEMGYADYGGGPRPAHAGHDMAAMDHGSGAADDVSVKDLDTETTRKPDVTVDLTARQQRVKLASGKTIDGYTLNGTTPGPLIEATVGQLVEVRLHNTSVKAGVSLHWHGVDVPNAEDGVAGVTQNVVDPGEDHTYRWIAPHAGSFWYHSHQMSNVEVAGGLFGGLVIHPQTPEAGVRSVYAMSHLYDGEPTLNGRSGDQAVIAKPGERVRVRVVNTDNGPQVAWTGAPYEVRAVDGFDVHQPTAILDRGVAIPAGGRIDLEVKVPTDGTAARVQVLGGAALVIGPEGSKAAAVKQPAKNLDLLDYGTPAPTGIDTGHFDRKFDYSIGRRPGFVDGKPGMWWSVNGHLYPDMPMMTVRQGDLVRMRISNHSGKVHPMHLHGHHAIVLSRDGRKASGSPWWFDSLDVENGESFDIAFVADNPGIWMDHCHNLKHAAQGMITHLMYEGVTTPYRLGDKDGNNPE